MLLFEADGKQLLREAGIAVPEGVVVGSEAGDQAGDRAGGGAGEVVLAGPGPWVAKAHVPVGGRGKAGGVVPFSSAGELAAIRRRLIGRTIKGCETRELLIEAAVRGDEHYLAVLVDAGAGGIRLLYSPQGGMDIEASGVDGAARYNALLPPDAGQLAAAVDDLARRAPASHRAALADAGRRLVSLFLDRGLMLAEINPLFALADGSVVAGDAKIVLDLNAVDRQPDLRALILAQRARYPDTCRKLEEDFDFVEIDPAGTVGLVTTGAGLSMMLIDELVGQGVAPYNFCDVRTGQMRGSPERLLRIMDWLAAARGVRVVLVNVFAGITDLGEFARLLITALRARPDFGRPIVARLVGNGEAEAARLIREHADLPVVLEPDLERAIAATRRLVEETDAA